MNSTQRIASIALFVMMAGLPALAAAADWERNPLLADDWRISVGTFFQSVDSKLSVLGTTTGINLPETDFNESLGLSHTDPRFSAYLHWRFGEKWSLALQYIDQKQSSTAILEEDLNWEGDVLNAGSEVSGGVTSEVYRVLFGRKFSTGPNHEFGVGFGLHWLELGAFAEGEFYVNGVSVGHERRKVSAGAPLPNIGAWYYYAWSPRWAAFARVDYFSASFDKYSGGLTNAGAGILFQAWRHVGFGLDYNYFDLNVDVDSGNWKGETDFTRDGPFLHLTFDW